MSSASSGQQQPRARASVLARRGKLWLVPTILTALVALFLSLLYMGGIRDPRGNLRQLPIGLVDTDQGPPLPGQQRTLGAQLSRDVVASTPAGAVQWRRLTRAQMQDQLASGKIYGALVVPADFTASVAALATPDTAARPALTVLTNPGLGSLGSSLASQITQGVAHQASLTIGRQLTAQAAAKGA